MPPGQPRQKASHPQHGLIDSEDELDYMDTDSLIVSLYFNSSCKL